MAIAPSPPRPIRHVGAATTAAVPAAAPADPWPRRLMWLLGIGAVVAIGMQLTPGFPTGLVVNVSRWFSLFEDWVIEHNRTSGLFVYVLNPLTDRTNAWFDQIVLLLSRMTWLGVIAGAAALAGVLAGWRLAVLAAAGFLAMGLLGLWDASLETLALLLLSVSIALVIGIPLGVWAGRRRGVDRILRPILDAMQTIPAYSYLIPLVLLFGIQTTTALIATVIFALPPAVRLTSLGLRGVPATSLEVADSFGSTSRQRLFMVQLPIAKPSVMLGVNQTIMMALGMVVIAAVVGFQGLGREVLHALQQTDVGEGLNAGLAIVAMAIVLDRVTYAWSRRDRRTVEAGVRFFGRVISHRQLAVGAAVATIAAVIVGRQVLSQQEFPDAWSISVAGPTNTAVEWITRNLAGVTGTVSDWMVRYALDPLRDVLQGVPWWLVCGGASLLAWRVSRRVGLAVTAFACIAAIGVLGMWDAAMDTLSQVVVAVALSVAMAIPLGILAARSDGFQQALKPLLDAMQTMPAFVYLVPVIALFNVGRVPGVIAALVYALPPCIRLTDLGIRQVPKEITEAAVSYGATPGQLLRKVQLPLARPSILLGVNQTIMMVLSVVIIAGLIGAGGLGLVVIQGLTHDELAQGVVAGISILLLAIVIDRITQAMGAAQRSSRGPVRTGGGWWTRLRGVGAKPTVAAESWTVTSTEGEVRA